MAEGNLYAKRQLYISSRFVTIHPRDQPTNQPTNDIGYNERRDNCAYMRSNAQIKNVLTKSA